MASYTSCIVIAILASMMMIAVNSDPSSQSDLYENAYSKNDDYNLINKRPSFFVGSRYGRSPSQLYGKKSRRLNVAPRNDRFFLGSRYGKRSNEYIIPAYYDQQLDIPSSSSSSSSLSLSSPSSSTSSLPSSEMSSVSFANGIRTSESEQQQQSNQLLMKDNNNYYNKLSCIYTGYKNYFKCNPINDISNNNIIFQQSSNNYDANSNSI